MKSAARDGESEVSGIRPAYGLGPTSPSLCRMRARRGAFIEGDLVQLTDPKGKLHTITLVAGKTFHTHRGGFAHDDLIGVEDGSTIVSSGGTVYLAQRPQLIDYVLGMPRGAAVIYPKDAARIVSLLDLEPGATVIEAGVGSGALSCYLLTAIGSEGLLSSYERREDFAKIAQQNVATWFGSLPANWAVIVGDLAHQAPPVGDAVVLDMLAPWDCLDVAAAALRPGGSLVCYVATTTQLSRTAEAIRNAGVWTEPRAEELMLRTWHLEGLSVRPDHRMNGHTGFLISSRRLAPGVELPRRRTRPAPGAYGDDYVPADSSA